MSFEPINIFSHKIDPAGVVQRLRESANDVAIKGPDDDWSELVVTLPKQGLFRRAKKLVLGHDAEYYDGADWSVQVLGMQNYFSEFPNAPNKSKALQLIRSFRFSLSVLSVDLDIDGDDDRLELLFEICRDLDAVIFTPSSLRDASGRILIYSSGRSDSDAVFPKMPEPADQLVAAANVEDEDDYEEPVPQTSERVARRALALTAVAARATLEMDAGQGEMDDPDVHRLDILKWVEELDIGDELEPQEWKVLQRKVGSLEQQDFINAMWRVEGLSVLAWALQIFPMPEYDELVIPPELYQSMGLFDAEAGLELLNKPSLRAEESLGEMMEHLLAYHWRVRDFSIRSEPMDFVEFSKDCWFGSFDISGFRTIDNDLAIGEVAISNAPPEEVTKAGSLAMERHLAINWLHGYSELYSETDTST